MQETIEVILPAEGKRPEQKFIFRKATLAEQSIALQQFISSGDATGFEEYVSNLLVTTRLEGNVNILKNSVKAIRQLSTDERLDDIIIKVYKDVVMDKDWSEEHGCETITLKFEAKGQVVDLELKSPSPKQIGLFQKEVKSSLIDATRRMLKGCLLKGEPDFNDLRLVFTLNLALTELVSDGDSIIAEKKEITQ